ncbi:MULTISPECIES: type II secretion system protein [Deinococcus]|uniref:Type II secretion system protein n=1 Tax=Deinococcus rufus TaxID=2136097 RepID=A0ABV7Z7B0_9DEIO|nr:type II secretion system protein [Deinococcus sp. AB2017081]WQE94542.1 type II secretion system protein [Deinococcus sp. AB2017081]
MRRGPVQGFTLIELLIGLAILGIVLGMAVPVYLRYLATLETAQVAGAYQQRLEAARGLARRGAQIRLSVTAGSNVATVETFTAGAWTPTNTYTLGNARASAARAVILYPPYGTLDAAPVTVSFASGRNAAITRNVRIISVMGKSVTP